MRLQAWRPRVKSLLPGNCGRALLKEVEANSSFAVITKTKNGDAPRLTAQFCCSTGVFHPSAPIRPVNRRNPLRSFVECGSTVHKLEEMRINDHFLLRAVKIRGGIATRNEIRQPSGHRVVAIVYGCRTDTLPKPPWQGVRLDTAELTPCLTSEYSRYLSQISCTMLGLYWQNGATEGGGDTICESNFSNGKEGTWFYRSLVVCRETGSDFLKNWASCLRVVPE